jgi:hypothetical protein
MPRWRTDTRLLLHKHLYNYLYISVISFILCAIDGTTQEKAMRVVRQLHKRSGEYYLFGRIIFLESPNTNRLVYAVDDEFLTTISCRYHY